MKTKQEEQLEMLKIWLIGDRCDGWEKKAVNESIKQLENQLNDKK